jgi:hypothetical protein
MTDLPDNINLNLIGHTLLAMQRELLSLRDDMTVVTAILNRIDRNQSSFIEELRVMRIQQDRVRSRVDRLEQDQNPHP